MMIFKKRDSDKRKMMTDTDMDELMTKIYEITHAIDYLNFKH